MNILIACACLYLFIQSVAAIVQMVCDYRQSDKHAQIIARLTRA